MIDYKYRETKYYCGDFLDVDIYPVFKKQKSRSGRYRATSEVQAKLNENNSVKRLERLLHCNFTTEDYALHLTYADDKLPPDAQTAQKDVQNFLRRVRRWYKAQGKELKYICVTEKGKRSQRVHHHLILSGGVDRSELESFWHLGYANTKRLQFTKNGVAGLANYITKQPLLFKRWSASRNLKKPIVKISNSKYSRKRARELFEFNFSNEKIEKLYPGYFVAEVCPVLNDINGGYYTSMRLYKKTAKLQM